jgi:hypothetical protein
MTQPKNGSPWTTLKMETVIFSSVGFNYTEQTVLKHWFLYTKHRASNLSRKHFYNKHYESLLAICFSTHARVHTHTLYQCESDRVAFIHIVYMSCHKLFTCSLWTCNRSCASCTAYYNSSQLLLSKIEMCFSHFRAFMAIWT